MDFSALGCKILSSQPMVAGRFISLAVMEFNFKGWVVWTTEDGYGIDFANPVVDPVVTHILERFALPREDPPSN